MLLNNTNSLFNFINGDRIDIDDSGVKASLKLFRSLLAATTKFAVAPFPGVIFRGTQMVKNSTPLGLFQRNISVDPETGKTKPKGIGIKFFNEHRYYGTNANKVLEILQADPWERSGRYAWATIPTTGFMYLFSSLFDFEDEEGNKSDDMLDNFTSVFPIVQIVGGRRQSSRGLHPTRANFLSGSLS